MWSVPFSFSLLVVFLRELLDTLFVCVVSVKTAPFTKITLTYSPPVTPQNLREKTAAMPLRHQSRRSPVMQRCPCESIGAQGSCDRCWVNPRSGDE